MDKFSQQFKDNLEGQPPPSYDMGDWEDMQSRLDLQQANKGIGSRYWMWAAGILLLMFVGANGLIYQRLRDNEQQIGHLKSKIDTLTQTQTMDDIEILKNKKDTQIGIKNQETTLTPKIQTVPSDIVLNKKDKTATILSTEKQQKNKLVLENKSTNHIPSSTNKTAAPYQNSELSNIEYRSDLSSETRSFDGLNTTETLLPNTKITTSNDGIKPTTESKLNNHSSATFSDIEKETFKNENQVQDISLNKLTTLIPSLPLTRTQALPLVEIPMVLKKQKKSFAQQVYELRPRGLELGLTLGTGMPLQTRDRHFDMYNFGVLGQVVFSPALRLWLSAEVADMDYETKKMGDKYGVPELASPNDDYEFEEAKVKRETRSMDIGFQYQFRSTKKWQPFIGLGLGMSNLTKNTVIYEFTADATQQQHNDSIFEKVDDEKAQNLQYALLKSGITYKMTNKWAVQLEGGYLHRIDDFNHQLLDLANGKLSVLYDF